MKKNEAATTTWERFDPYRLKLTLKDRLRGWLPIGIRHDKKQVNLEQRKIVDFEGKELEAK